MNQVILISIAVLVCGACQKDNATDTTQTTSSQPADNTKTNQRDKSGATLTPGDQSNASADIELSAQIRKQLMADDSLSSNAKNVKIISRNGAVVLRGPVNSEAEKSSVQTKAASIAGVNHVENDLDVVAK